MPSPIAGAINDTNASQCSRLLDYLKEHGSLTTIEARQILGIMNPSQRVSELRNRYAFPIETVRTYAPDETGTVHRMALYIWRGFQHQHGQLTLLGMEHDKYGQY